MDPPEADVTVLLGYAELLQPKWRIERQLLRGAITSAACSECRPRCGQL